MTAIATSTTERVDPPGIAQNSVDAEPYGKPRRVWVEGKHVFLEAHDGKVFCMTPEVAIEVSRVVGQAGTDALVNRILNTAAQQKPDS
jgi:hypothetical protein